MRDLTPTSARPPAVSQPDGPYIRAIRPLNSFLAHWKLCLVVGLFVMLAGLPVAWWKGRPVYKAEASVLVAPRFEANLEDDEEIQFQSNSQYRQYVQQNVRTIPRLDIVETGLANLEEKRYWWQAQGESDEDAAGRLQGALQIRPVPDTYQITVGLEGDSPAGLAEIVNTVVEAFLAKAKEEEMFASEERVRALSEERNRLNVAISAKLARRAEISGVLGVSVFTESFPNPYDQLLVGAKEALARVRRDRIAAESGAAAVRPADNPDASGALSAIAEEQAAQDAMFTSLLSDLAQRRARLLSKRSGLTDEHPGRRAIDRELRENRTELLQAFADVSDDHARRISSRREAVAFEQRRLERQLETEVAAQQERATWYTTLYQEAIQIGKDADRARTRLDRVHNRIDFLKLESSAPGFLRVFSEARDPRIPVGGGRRKLAILVLIAAVGLGLAAPVAFDLLDPRVHTVSDLEGFLRLPSMGGFPSSDSSSLDQVDAARRIAAVLAHERKLHQTNIIAFTATRSVADTATAVRSLRNALTNMGIDAVVADARRSEGADHIPDIQGFVSSLRDLAQDHELVLVDAPALTESADAEYLVRFVDAAVLVVPASVTLRGELTKLGERMERLAPGSFGTVLTGIRSESRTAPRGLLSNVTALPRLARRINPERSSGQQAAARNTEPNLKGATS
jgi:polysaccharide biosynthesis transport protein